MPDKTIVIDGYIGPYGYSKQFVRAMLDGTKGKNVLVKISSLGGAFDHALDIQNQFSEHGNITAELSGFVASSATIIALGARSVKMADNSYYLIHKIMSWIDEFGYFNEDDIQLLIDKLEKDKNENAKMTLNLASAYAKKTGKPVKDILDLMKKETWLLAQEAKDWGFVDEIYTPGEKVNFLEDLKLVAMIEASGYPSPKREHSNFNNNMETEKTTKKDEKSLLASLKEQVNKVLSMLNGNDKAEDKKEKTDEQPTMEEQMKDLANQVKIIAEKLNGKQEEKKDDKAEDKKDEKKEDNVNADLKKEIENLKSQIENLANAAAPDADPDKETDAAKSSPHDDFQANIKLAREMREYLNG